MNTPLHFLELIGNISPGICELHRLPFHVVMVKEGHRVIERSHNLSSFQGGNVSFTFDKGECSILENLTLGHRERILSAPSALPTNIPVRSPQTPGQVLFLLQPGQPLFCVAQVCL